MLCVMLAAMCVHAQSSHMSLASPSAGRSVQADHGRDVLCCGHSLPHHPLHPSRHRSVLTGLIEYAHYT